jgi:hypothetical protein
MSRIVGKLLELLNLQTVRLSDTKRIQSAFRKAWQSVFEDALSTLPELATFSMALPAGILSGRGLRDALNSVNHNSFVTLGFKPEHIRVLKNLCFLLEQCSRVAGTSANQRIFEPLFHFKTPITPTLAEAMEEVIVTVTGCIEPKRKP